MGLDMYLSAKIYIGAYYDHNNIKGEINITKNGEKLDIDLKEISEITVRCGYWRKANHIHKWFVNNVQDGDDDCKEYYVSDADVNTLLDLCHAVTNNADKEFAEENLPIQEGFFFGGSEYDEWYYQDVKDTIEILEKAKKLSEIGYSIYYQSSW